MEQIRDLIIRATSAADRQGRIEAYGRVVERFRDMACGYAYSVLGDFHLAEDAAQEAFVIAFDKLSQLAEPAAFPGWLRRIVGTACSRLARKKTVATEPLESAGGVRAETPQPDSLAERNEMRDEVLKAIGGLPDGHREVTTLFYINGYSQSDIADFLEIPVGTVKNRLSASRSRLKERMLNMVEETLHNNAPDERFDRKVIEELLSQPRLLEIPDHPVRHVWESICKALPDYQVIMGEEIIERDTQEVVSGGIGYVYRNPDQVLHTSTTVTTFSAIAGRKPPVRLLTAGRVFRVLASGSECGVGARENATHLRTFHMADAICVCKGADRRAMQNLLGRLAKDVLGLSGSDLRWEPQDLPLFENAIDLDVRLCDAWTTIASGGLLPPHVLRKNGFNPDDVSCFGFGLGLERFAMVRYDIDDIRKLWQPPYVK